MPVDYRPIAEADIEACAEVFYVSDDELMTRIGLPPNPRNTNNLTRLFRHMLATDPERMWLAQDEGRPVGFGMAVERAALVFLSMLFVAPGLQARGVGRQLLERCMANTQRRAVCIFSPQPVSAALYALYGMVPQVPMYTMTGKLTKEMPRLPRGLHVSEVEMAATDSLDLEVIGITRQQDHAAWEGWGRLRHGLFDHGRLLGYGYAQQSGRLGPFVVRDGNHLFPFVAELTRRVAAIEDWMIHVPGSAAETFVALLRHGLRLDGPPVIYCATDSQTDYSRYLPSTFALP